MCTQIRFPYSAQAAKKGGCEGWAQKVRVLMALLIAIRLIIPAGVAYDTGSAQDDPSTGDHVAPQVAGRNDSDEQGGDIEEAD
jgi:hypothetical protein